MLSSVQKKMLVQESAKVKDKAPKKIHKEDIDSTSDFFFPKGTSQWQKYLVKIRRNYKAREYKNHKENNV